MSLSLPPALSRENLFALLDSSAEAVVLYDAAFRFLYMNAECERRIGWPQGELIGKVVWEVLPDAIVPFRESLTRSLRERIPLTFEGHNAVRGTWTECRCLPVELEYGAPGLAVFYRDVTERHEAERARAAEQEAFAIVSRVPDGFLAVDREWRVTFANPQSATVLAGEPILLGRNLWEALTGIEDTDSGAGIRRVMNERTGATFAVFHLQSGKWLDISAFPAPHGGLYMVFRDITERKNLEQERERLLAGAVDRANRDPLTGLLNHRAFYERLHTEVASREQDGETLALILLDLNHFKFFNEAFGHLVGDAVLRQVTDALRSCCREGDTLGRLGGDEFALMITEAGEREALNVVAEIEDCMGQEGFVAPGSDIAIPLGFSFGVALYPRETASPQEMVKLADERLLKAKQGDQRRLAPTSATEAPGDESFSLLDALVTAVDNKDRYTRKHSEDVLRYSQAIAEKLELGAEERESLRVAALLHDVGKIGIPDRILRLPAHLTPADYEVVKKHATMGAAIIGAVPGMEHAIPAVRHHHEAWNGTGYPDGLARESIPLSARILAVADAYSAMTTDRPYRKEMPEYAARAILELGAGTQWDPALTALFLATFPPS